MATAPDSVMTFTKRSGTTDRGKEYEDILIANLVLKLLTDKLVTNFRISSNADGFGGFDDVVLEIQYQDCRQQTIAFQLKHLKNKTLTKEGLCAKSGNFSIISYLDKFRKMEVPVDKIILFSNINCSISKKEELSLNDDKVIMKDFKPDGLLNISKYGRYYEFKAHNDNDFFDKFFLFTNQTNVDQTRNDTLNMYSTIFSCIETFDKYLQFVTQWSLAEGKKEKLSKEFMKRILALIVLSPCIKSLQFSDTEVSNNTKLFRNAIMEFEVTIFSEKNSKRVTHIWTDYKKELELVETNRLCNKYQILTKYIQNLNEQSDLDSSKILWLMNKCPLVVPVSGTVMKIIMFCETYKFIVIGDVSLQDSPSLSIFRNATDLNSKPKIDVHGFLNNFSCSVQAKHNISLDELCLENPKICNDITTNELLQMLDEPLKIGGRKEVLPIPHIDRFLSRNIINKEFFNRMQSDAVVIITNINIKKNEGTSLIDNFIYKIEIKGIEFLGLDERENVTATEKIIYVSEQELSLKEFRNLCKLVPRRPVHQFQYINEDFDWVRSNCGINKLKEFRIETKNIDETNFFKKSDNHNSINIICADPGMGKSISMKNLKNLTPLWTILIQPKDHSLYFQTQNTSGNDFIDYIFEKTSKCSDLEKKISKIMCRQIVFIWDGLDEVSEENLPIVLALIKDFSGKNYKQWLTSRCNLKKFLEKELQVFSRNIEQFDLEQQNSYIEKRLNCTGSELEDIKARIQRSIRLVQYNEILGIPLQVYMFTELFRQNPEKYKKLLSNIFLITDLYRYFVDEKFNLYHKVKANLDDSNDAVVKLMKTYKNERLKQYEEAALKTYLKDEILQKLHIDCDYFLSEIQTGVDCVGIIVDVTDGKIPNFLHNSYGEYFAACYLSKNCQKVPKFADFIFEASYNNVRFLFDLLMAENCPAHVAVLYKNIQVLQENDEYIKLKDKGGRNPLHLACSWGKRFTILKETKEKVIAINEDNVDINDDTVEYQQIIQYLADRCNVREVCDLFSMDSYRYGDITYCLRAILILSNQFNLDFKELRNFNNITTILVNSIKFDYSNVFDDIPLITIDPDQSLIHLAVTHGSENCLKKMVKNPEFNKEINAILGEEESTPLHVACYYGRVEIVKILLEVDADVTITNKLGHFPIYIAALRGFPEVVKLLVDYKINTMNVFNAHGTTSLLTACETGNLRACGILLDNGADINLSDKYGYTPLLTACRQKNEEIIELLINRKADVNRANNYGDLPLFIAASYGLSSTKMLINTNANVNGVNRKGNSPMHACCWNQHLDVLDLLIKNGADVNVSNKFGLNLLHMCARYHFYTGAKLLLRAGADVDLRNKYGETFEEMKLRYSWKTETK